PELATRKLRPFDRARDFPGLSDLIGEVNRHDDSNWRPSADELERDWGTPRGNFDPNRDAIVVEADGALIGAGSVIWAQRDDKIVHDLDIWVRPDHRRHGIGREILAWLEARSRASVADGSGGPMNLPHVLNGGLISANAASAAFAADAGYETIRYGFQMQRPLDLPILEVALPEGLEVRPVLPEDHRAIWD